jgi:hypothetical protein
MSNKTTKGISLKVRIPTKREFVDVRPIFDFTQFSTYPEETLVPTNTPVCEIRNRKRKSHHVCSDSGEISFKPYNNLDEFLKFFSHE